MTFFFKNYYRFLILFFLILTTLSASGCFSSSGEPSKEWTVMVYLDGDDSALENNAIIDFNEMEKGLSDAITNGNRQFVDTINIIVMVDRFGGAGGTSAVTEINGSDWSDTRLYRVKPDTDMNHFNSERLDDGSSAYSNHVPEYGEKNMGDPSTLSDFIDFSKENFPANHYALILWNHGGAAQKKSAIEPISKITKSICWDADNNNDTLYLDELQQALEENFDETDRLDIIGFDACLMATVEIAYELKSSTDFMVASMNYIQANGWSYDRIFGDIKETSVSPLFFSTHMAQTYKAYIDSTPINQNYGESISVTDISQVDNLVGKINSLGVAIAAENNQSDIEILREASYNYYDIDASSASNLDSVAYPYYDIYDLCNRTNTNESFSINLRDAALEVITAMTTTIVYSYGDINLPENTGQSQSAYSGINNSKGLSIFFSRGDMTYNSLPHYNYQWWYTNEDTATELNDSSKLYGHIDFCFSNADGNVDGWRELMEYWYDNPDSATPSSY